VKVEPASRIPEDETGGPAIRRAWSARNRSWSISRPTRTPDRARARGRADVFCTTSARHASASASTPRRSTHQSPPPPFMAPAREPRALVAQAGLPFVAQRDRRQRDHRVRSRQPAAEPDFRGSRRRARDGRCDPGRPARARADRAWSIPRDDDADLDGVRRIQWSLRYAGKSERSRSGSARFGALHRLYDTGEGWLFLECHREREWRALCEVVDPALARDARFATRRHGRPRRGARGGFRRLAGRRRAVAGPICSRVSRRSGDRIDMRVRIIITLRISGIFVR
jgi:hypothetical protein